MGAILGLLDTEQLKDEWSLNARRAVFYQYPNGTAPLMGLLSLIDTPEDEIYTDKSEFGWHEHRNVQFEYKTAGTTGPFSDGTGANGANTTLLTAGGWNLNKGDTIRVALDKVDTVQERDVLEFRKVPNATTGTTTFQGVVTAVYQTPKTVDLKLNADVGSGGANDPVNGSTAKNLDVVMVGSATAEADRSRKGFWVLPTLAENYTQIFRHAFSFSRNALKQGLKWDASGPYKTKAKQNSLKHMQALEYAGMFSNRSVQLVTNDDGETVPRRTMGGLMWFLRQWELGNTTNGGAIDYRPDGADISADAWDSSDQKRILEFGGNTVSKTEFDEIIERAFRYTNDSSFEKLVLGGGGLLRAFNQFADREGLRQMDLHHKDDTYGMHVTSWETPWGTLHFKVHPLLNQTAVYRDSGFILDCGEIKYTPLQDADTSLLKNRQPRDYDGRKDEWMTEYGLEVRYPENHMWLDNLGGITS